MKIALLLATPIAFVLAFGLVVLFWAAVSQIRYSSYFRHRPDRPPSLGAAGWIDFYRRTLTGAYILLWWSIRAGFQTGLRQPEGATQGRPVLCVHGLFMNSSCMWGIRRRLEGLGRPTRGVFMGAPLPTPMSYAKPLTRVMKLLAEQFPDDGFDIVAHSIGGVMVREVLRQSPELAGSVHRIVTLGSPHHGTAVVRWLKFGPLYRMLSLESPYLEDLESFAQLAPGSAATTVGTLHDLVVYPAWACHLDGTDQVALERISHLGLMTASRALDEVERALCSSADKIG